MPRVTMIDWTGAGHPDPWYAARKLIIAKNTRLSRGANFAEQVMMWNEGEMLAELASIANTIRSSWEFISYTFKIEEITRATCDQITRSRVGVSFAVMTQRSVDQSNFEYTIPEAVKARGLSKQFENHMDEINTFYRLMINAGVPTQDARAIMPMAAHSPLIAEYNLRSISELVGKRDNLRAQGEYRDVAAEMKRLILERHSWTRMFLAPMRTFTPCLEAILKETLGDSVPSDKPDVARALKELDLLKATWD
jgi:flavin-dependent thymidylate synthase